MVRRLLFAALLCAPALALGQDAPGPSTPPATTGQAPVHRQAAAEGPEVKHDQGTVRTVDAQRGLIICDMPDGQVTYDVSQAQLLDADGKPAGVAASGLKTADKVRITYTIDTSCEHAPACKGALASEVRVLK